MDMFDIPNRIVNGIVIADGRSSTAARRAGYHNIIPSVNNVARQSGMSPCHISLPSYLTPQEHKQQETTKFPRLIKDRA
jgi:hypothetical protein